METSMHNIHTIEIEKPVKLLTGCYTTRVSFKSETEDFTMIIFSDSPHKLKINQI